MNSIDFKYIMLLSNRLEGFKIKSHQPFRANFRCVLCGDSHKSKSKTRGWLLEKTHEFTSFYCHNCNASHNLRYFLQQIDPLLYNDYVSEHGLAKISGKREEEIQKYKVPKFRKTGSPLLKIKKISQLNGDHKARLYVDSRKIPTNKHYKLYYAHHFVEWVNSLIPNKLEMKEHARLVLPFIDEKNTVFGFQGRAFDKDQLRYITIMLDDSKEKVYGLESIRYNERYYITEGPIDSLFLENALAMSGASFNDTVLQHKENAVIVFDAEPRNRQIVEKMRKAIQDGYKVCFWPKTGGKDINDKILSGYTSADVKLMIDENTYSGLSAEMKLVEWKKT